jgi:hypothetical protein
VDARLPGQVHDALRADGGHRGLHRGGVLEVGLHEADPVAQGRGDLVPRPDQSRRRDVGVLGVEELHEVAPHETGDAGDEHVHGL